VALQGENADYLKVDRMRVNRYGSTKAGSNPAEPYRNKRVRELLAR